MYWADPNTTSDSCSAGGMAEEHHAPVLKGDVRPSRRRHLRRPSGLGMEGDPEWGAMEEEAENVTPGFAA